MPAGVPAPDAQILERNLRALGASPRLAALIAGVPAADLNLRIAPDGGLTGVLEGRRLASAHRPVEEGRRHAASIPLEQAAGVAVLGLGLGHHLAPLAERLKQSGVLFIFEPDLGLVRAVLERCDVTPWAARTHVRLLTDADDAAAIGAAVSGVEGLLSLGFRFFTHPPARARLGDSADRFSARFAEVMRAVRTTVMTTLVQVESTIRNELGNLGAYARALGIGDIAGLHAGRPAVVVAAGPSLHRNLDELARPGVRERVVVVAVQTVLKTLLSRGIRPDYVTSLDYAEVSARFYEGLTASDVEGVELVVEPKAHPAVLRSFPGVVRCPASRVLDQVLGPELATVKGALRPGATVAHMAYYLARHAGCDPVILIGQDLGFTDGQYYHAGAAIHQVWSGELNAFNTLEMLEWQRIVRSRSMLHRRTDHLGRPVYTDEQMTTYLAQFERDFLADSERGLTVIDATEGGVLKRHTRVQPLRAALESLPPGPPRASRRTGTPAPPERLDARLRERVAGVRQQVWRVGSLSRRTAELLGQMRECSGDRAKVDALIGRVYALRDEVESLEAGYDLVHFLNQTGALNRMRADRALELDDALDPTERQLRQIERDRTNVTWLADAADELGSMLDETARTFDGRPARRPSAAARPAATGVSVASPAARVWAVVHADAERCGLGAARDLSAPLAGGHSALDLTLSRLACCRELGGILVLGTDGRDPRGASGARGGPPQRGPGPRIEFVASTAGGGDGRARSVAASRLVARHAWRGAPGNVSVFDEACDPSLVAPLLERFGIDAVAPVGADWCLIDPDLVDRIARRHSENPQVNQLTFSQAPPGLGTCVVAARAIRELAESRDRAGAFGTLGALLGYIPIAPQADPIGKPVCVSIAPAVRDLGVRCIPDAPFERSLLLPLIGRAAADPASVDAGVVAAELANAARRERTEIVSLELCTRRVGTGQRALWLGHDTGPGARIPLAQALDAVERFADPFAVLSLEGRGDPLLHPDWRTVVAAALAAGYGAVHVRTDLSGSEEDVRALVDLAPALVSVDLLAHGPQTYRTITGVDGYARARANLELMLGLRPHRGGLPAMWVIPRMTRCDAVYAELEHFYDHWLMQAGAATIDPLPVPMPGERIAPLPPPPGALGRLRAGVVTIRCGRSPEDLDDALAHQEAGA